MTVNPGLGRKNREQRLEIESGCKPLGFAAFPKVARSSPIEGS